MDSRTDCRVPGRGLIMAKFMLNRAYVKFPNSLGVNTARAAHRRAEVYFAQKQAKEQAKEQAKKNGERK